VRTICKKAKHFFTVAIEYELVDRNPFAKITVTVTANPSRFYFVSRDEIDIVLQHCDDLEWKAIFTLARYGGLRCPSEVLALRWRDIDWAHQRVRVPSSKTEHFEGGGSRTIPLFPELAGPLRDALEAAEPGSVYVISHYQDMLESGPASAVRLNLRTQAHRIIRRAGLEPWEKVFQNMRSSRETELAETFPMHVVCRWIGNSQPVAAQHYLQVTDDHFVKATAGSSLEKGSADDAAGADAEATHKATQRMSADDRAVSQAAEAADSQPVDNAGASDGLRDKSLYNKGLQVSPCV
jgi:integrase